MGCCSSAPPPDNNSAGVTIGFLRRGLTVTGIAANQRSKPTMSGNDAALSAEDCLWAAVASDEAEALQQAIRDGANVNTVRGTFSGETTPLLAASVRGAEAVQLAIRAGANENAVRHRGSEQIIRNLLDAGADARWRDSYGSSAILLTSAYGDFSTVQLLINHDNGLLKSVDDDRQTPLLRTVRRQHSDMVRFLLDSGADPHHVNCYGQTALMIACHYDNVEIVRLLLAAGLDVDARDKWLKTALHFAAHCGRIEIMRKLILQHNANMFAVAINGWTPFDQAGVSWSSNAAAVAADHLVEMYGNKLTQDHDRLALHELLKVAEYSFVENDRFHPPLNPLQIILPLGTLRLKHLRTLLHTLDPELIRSRDDTGKIPVHIACQTNAPVEVLALILEFDPTTLHIADYAGALPIHLLCGTLSATEYASVRYLVEQGGVGTLAARNRQGLLPLHVLCRSRNPPLRAVQHLIQSFPGSVAVQTNAGQYPFMMAAATKSSSAPLSVLYELVRADPSLIKGMPTNPV